MMLSHCRFLVTSLLFGLSVTLSSPVYSQAPADAPAAKGSSEKKADSKPKEVKASTPKQETAKETAPNQAEMKTPESKPEPKKPADKPARESEKAKKEKTQPKKPESQKLQSDKPDPKKAGKKPDPKPAPKPDPEWVAKGVWTLPPVEGPPAIDFALVGEYVGPLQKDEGDARSEASENSLGVQIRAIGDGEFEALAYNNGLPGQDGFDESSQRRLIGRRSGETLVLSGGPWAMFAGPDQCTIISVEGELLGKLPRVQRISPTLGAAPPKGAMVLFDGTNTDQFSVGEMTPEGLLLAGADINFMLHDFDMHLEFRIPHMPGFREQQRGNSGVYLQSRYECQVLDSFGTDRLYNGLGALYRFKKPAINMAFPPLVWQSYDIHFTAARFAADGKKLRNAHVTSWVNGVKVQDDQELPGPTGAGKDEEPILLPTKLQNHKDPVRYRNIWVIDRGLTGGVPFPPLPNKPEPKK